MLKTEMLKSEKRERRNVARLGLFSFSAFQLFSFFLGSSAFAHDPLEISATVYLHTNRLELRAVMMRQAILLAADHQGVPLLDFSILAERAEALPMLRSLAPGLFTLTCGTNVLIATDVKVILGAEDHVGFNFTFATTNTTVKLDAKLLAHLPKQDPYGVNVTVLDLVNNQVLGQKLLGEQSSVIEVVRPQTVTTNQPPTAPKPTPLLP